MKSVRSYQRALNNNAFSGRHQICKSQKVHYEMNRKHLANNICLSTWNTYANTIAQRNKFNSIARTSHSNQNRVRPARGGPCGQPETTSPQDPLRTLISCAVTMPNAPSASIPEFPTSPIYNFQQVLCGAFSLSRVSTSDFNDRSTGVPVCTVQQLILHSCGAVALF